MDTIEKIKGKAKKDLQRIVLPESTDSRMLKAAAQVVQEGTAELTLTGNLEEIQSAAKENQVSLDGIEILDHQNADDFDEYVDEYVELRKHKGMTPEKAKQIISDPLFYSAMMIRKGQRDGMVAGAVNSTANVLRSTIQIVGLAKGVKTVSSCFLMILPEERSEFGHQGNLVYSDAGVVPNPTPEQLADIATAAAGSFRELVGEEPVVALLSFSTKGSASHPDVEKVTRAVEILKQRQVDFVFDGELQSDAALVASVGRRKCPDSPVAGKANVLIFPDLDAGNICYKITQRLAGAQAYGPIIQGGALPVNDLSRGCSAEDIVTMVAVTAAQAIGARKK
jgi:phosphate acetyltransferase